MSGEVIPFKPRRRLSTPQENADKARARAERNANHGRAVKCEGDPVPARITIALNMADRYGPEVDRACGVEEPTVDEWEQGIGAPTRQQVGQLALLSGFPPAFFYMPIEPGPLLAGPLWMCGTSCKLVESPWVDERGVLHYPDDEQDGQIELF